MESLAVSKNGPGLLTETVHSKFRGLSGDFDLTDRQLQVSSLQIINVVGGSWREIGFWTSKNGLSRKLNVPGPLSMLDLNPVIWPGESTEIPRGWEIPANGNKLMVGVRTSANPEFIWASKDPATNITTASGLYLRRQQRGLTLIMITNYLTQPTHKVQGAMMTLFTKFIFR